MKKKIGLAVFGLACTFLVIVLSLYFYSKTEHAKILLVDKINTAIPGTLSAENIEVSFINPSVKLDGIKLKDGQNKSCLRFKSLLLHLKIRPLFQKVLEISALTVTRPEISLVMDINGRMNLIDALIPKNKELSEKGIVEKESKGIPFNVIVKKAQIIEGILTFNDPEKQIKLKSFNVEVTGGDLFERHLSLVSSIKDSRIKLKDKEILINNLSLFSELKQGSKLDFDLELDSDLCAFKAKGKAYDIITAPGIDFNLTASSPLEALNRFLGHEMDLGGMAKVTLAGKGPLNNPEVIFNLDVANPKIDENLKGDSINLSAALADRILLIKKGRLNILGSDISLKGEADLKDFFPKGFLNPPQNPDTLKYDFSFDQKNGDFQHLEKWVKGFSGRFSSSGRIKGKGIHLETLAADYDFNLVLEKFKQDKPETDFLDFETDISGTIEQGICRIKGFKAQTPGTFVGARGQYDIVKKRLGASLDVKASDLSLITLPLDLPEVKGSVDGKISIAGDIFNPELTAFVTGKNFMAQGVSIQDFQFAGSLDPLGQVTIQQLTAKDQDLVIDVKGTADVFETAFKLKDTVKTSLLVSGQNVTPARLIKPDALKIDPDILNALINFNLNMDLGYAMGASMNKINFSNKELPVNNILADLDFQKKEIVIALKKIVTLNASLDTEKNQYHARIDFSDSDLVPLLESAGIKGIQASIDGQMSATGIIPDAVPKDVIKELDAAHGRIHLKAKTQGSFKEPDVTVQADFYDLAYRLNKQNISISNLNSNLVATRKTIQINAMTANINDGRFSLTGRLDLKDDKIQNGKLAVSAVGIDIPILSKTGAKQSIFMEKLDSNLDIHLQYNAMTSQGAADQLKKEIPIKTIQADLDLKKLSAAVLLDQTTDLRASFDPDTAFFDLDLKFDRLLLEPLFKLADLNQMKGLINGHVVSKGKLNLALPPEVMGALRKASGNVSCSADISGSFEQPDVNAIVTLSEIKYPIPRAGVSISNLNGKIKLLKDELAIENIAADLDKGRVSINGKIGLKDYMPVKGDIRFKGDHIALEMPDMAQVEFSHDFTFSGTRKKSNLSGTFQMIKGEYYKDFTFDLADALEHKKRGTSTSGAKNNTGIPLIENMALNIDVDYNDPFVVDNNLVFILVEPNINISGTAVNPVITGRAKIVEGTLIYQKKEFQIEKGIIDFVDPYKIDPDINLAARTEIRDWIIKLKVSGKKDNLKFQLFSEPRQTHEDILSLLITGKTTKELGKGGGGSYTNILTDKAANVIGKTVKESTPLDSFKIGYDNSGSQSSNVSVTMGKKLSKRMEVTYSMETLDEETVHTNAAEYKILENVILKAFNDQP
jgi:autotransporter translocation and assembly factor TamB